MSRDDVEGEGKERNIEKGKKREKEKEKKRKEGRKKRQVYLQND